MVTSPVLLPIASAGGVTSTCTVVEPLGASNAVTCGATVTFQPGTDLDSLDSLTITPPAAASSGAGLRDSERAWLATRERREAKPPPGKRRANKASADPQRQAYRCRAKRRALDAVKAELRRGYKPAKGERLRRRRRAHEDYLSTFCS